MRRIMSWVVAALVMAAVVGAMAMPAFAGVHCSGDLSEEPFTSTCSGGQGYSEPGGIDNGAVGEGGRVTVQCGLEFGCANDFAGGGGGKTTIEGGGLDSAGGGGGRCELGEYGDQCVGSLF